MTFSLALFFAGCAGAAGAHPAHAQGAPAVGAAVVEPRIETARPATVAKPSSPRTSPISPDREADPQARHAAAGDEALENDLSEAQHRELTLLMDLVKEAKFDLPRRALAAQSLLDRGWPAAMEQLVALLVVPGEVGTQRAIARALANHAKAAPGAFVQPLLDLLGHSDVELRSDVAKALGRYGDAELMEAIKAMALDSEADVSRRLGAIAVLARDHAQASVDVLMQLLDASTAQPVREAAYAALGDLTGMTELGDDAAGWRQWWARHRDLDRESWLMALTDNFARQSAARDRQQRQLQSRLTSLYSQLYRAVPQDGRPPLLVAMLSDTVPAIRQEAIRLIGQMLTDGQAISPELRTALVAELDDPSADIRQSAARLLYALKDETAADVVSERLAAGTEHHPGVLQAYLQVMARVPRAAMVDQALLLLSDPVMRGEAAGALAAAARAELLSQAQLEAAANIIRQQLAEGAAPERQAVALLGLAGHEEDWVRITSWLDSSDDAVKEAAARAWAASTRALEPLAERAGDPVIGPIAIAAAQRRGSRSSTMLALLQHEPKLDQTRQSWERALIAMAGRAEPAAVLLLDTRLQERNASLSFRTQVLTAAIDVATAAPAAGTVSPTDPQTLVNLLLARAGVRLSAGDPQTALTDFQRINSQGLTLAPAQQQALELGMLRAQLLAGDVTKATQHAEKLLSAEEDGGGPLFVMRFWTCSSQQRSGRVRQGRSTVLATCWRALSGLVTVR